MNGQSMFCMSDWSGEGLDEIEDGHASAKKMMSKAHDRQSILMDALHQVVNVQDVVIPENSDDPDIKKDDYAGIDAYVLDDSGKTHTVSFKTRCDKKRSLEDLDLPLRKSGRAGRDSKEWENFTTGYKKFPDFLVYGLFHQNTWYCTETISEVIVLDTASLRYEYFEDELRHTPPLNKNTRYDDGETIFLDMDFIRHESRAPVFHRKYWGDETIIKGDSIINKDMDEENKHLSIAQSQIDVEYERKGIMLVCESEPQLMDELHLSKISVGDDWYITHSEAESIIKA